MQKGPFQISYLESTFPLKKKSSVIFMWLPDIKRE